VTEFIIAWSYYVVSAARRLRGVLAQYLVFQFLPPSLTQWNGVGLKHRYDTTLADLIASAAKATVPPWALEDARQVVRETVMERLRCLT